MALLKAVFKKNIYQFTESIKYFKSICVIRLIKVNDLNFFLRELTVLTLLRIKGLYFSL